MYPILTKALATVPDTARSPNGLSGIDVAGSDVADGDATGDVASDAAPDRDLRRRRRRGGRSTVVGANELGVAAGEGGVPRVTVAV